jgi:hypothetical protein
VVASRALQHAMRNAGFRSHPNDFVARSTARAGEIAGAILVHSRNMGQIAQNREGRRARFASLCVSGRNSREIKRLGCATGPLHSNMMLDPLRAKHAEARVGRDRRRNQSREHNQGCLHEGILLTGWPPPKYDADGQLATAVGAFTVSSRSTKTMQADQAEFQ